MYSSCYLVIRHEYWLPIFIRDASACTFPVAEGQRLGLCWVLCPKRGLELASTYMTELILPMTGKYASASYILGL